MNRQDIVATINPDLTLTFSIPRLNAAKLAAIGIGEKIRVEYRRWYKKRSTDQNSLMWGHDYPIIIQFLAENGEPGFTAEDIHAYHKKELIGFEPSKFPGLYKLRSTTDMDTVEFSTFRERYCRMWAERGCFIPDPE